MLALMLRVTLALQAASGAAMGYAMNHALGQPGTALTTLLAMALGALALPLLGALLTVAATAVVSRAQGSGTAWWRALLGEYLESIRTFMLRQPWAWGPPVLQAATAPVQRVPVLLVHGFVCNHRIWDSLLPALRAQGHSVLAVDLEPVFASIDDYAPHIEQAVQALCAHSGQTQVALVGHSMGGLAIRAWMRRYGSTAVARAITLGTPHVGTQMPAWLSTPNGDQMAWHSPWLQALADSESEATRALFRVALTAQDNIVFPQRAQTLPGLTPRVFEGLGHLQLCTAAEVQHWVCAELAVL